MKTQLKDNQLHPKQTRLWNPSEHETRQPNLSNSSTLAEMPPQTRLHNKRTNSRRRLRRAILHPHKGELHLGSTTVLYTTIANNVSQKPTVLESLWQTMATYCGGHLPLAFPRFPRQRPVWCVVENLRGKRSVFIVGWVGEYDTNEEILFYLFVFNKLFVLWLKRVGYKYFEIQAAACPCPFNYSIMPSSFTAWPISIKRESICSKFSAFMDTINGIKHKDFIQEFRFLSTDECLVFVVNFPRNATLREKVCIRRDRHNT